MGDVVPLFPEGQPVGEKPDRDFHNLDVPAIRVEIHAECNGVMHVFAGVPGRCQCGQSTWGVAGEMDPPEAIGIHYVA